MVVFGWSVPTISPPVRQGLLPLVVALVLSIGVSGYLYINCLRPAEERMGRAEAAFQTAKQQHATLQATRTLQERVKATTQQLSDVWQVLPTQNEFTSLAMAISELGRAERVLIPGMSYDLQPKKDDGLPIMASVSFTATGEYAAIYRFIHRLETTEPYLVIESLNATRASKADHDEGAATLVVFQIKVATFLRPNPPTGRMA